MQIRPVILCILDGWGWREERDGNAVAAAHTPVYDRLITTCPHALLRTSGADVGLPPGQMGNSEVGHMTIGAGRVMMQDLPRIDAAVAGGTLARNPALERFIGALKDSGGACHLIGLMSPGGVHSHQNHMAALASLIAGAGVKVWVHAILDGRDTPPKSADSFVGGFFANMAPEPGVRGATVAGRYFAMDRDGNWDRIEPAYLAMAEARAAHEAADAPAAVAAAYARGETDEFAAPTVVSGYPGMADGDGMLMANFRADRARELLTALTEPGFDGFARPRPVAFAARAGMVSYSAKLDAHLDALFPPEEPENTLGAVVSRAGLRQLRIAETEKYAHVTFFLNGGREAEFPGEERILVPSPKVATYDLQPEMSAPEVTERLVAAILSKTLDLIVVNYANPDMVGHTGVFSAAVKAVEAVDACLGRLENAVKTAGGVMIVTADHGNVELMRDPDSGGPHTAHTTSPVPVLMVNATALGRQVHLTEGGLADLAPTILDLMGLERPRDMTGVPLTRGCGERRETA